MDYEKAYKEALERAKALNGTLAAGRDFLAEIFPELAESEDERIRKELVAFFIEVRNREGDEGYWHDLKVADILAYLEKQKENPKSSDSIPSNCMSDAKCEDRWHKVSDSLPDNPREVLCKDEAGNYFIGRYYVGEGWEISNYDDEDKPHHLNPPVSKWIEFPSEKQKESLHITEMCKENAGSFTDEDGDRTINGCLLAANAERRCKRASEELLEELGLADYTKFFYEQGVEKGKREKQKEQEHICDSAQYEEGFKTGLEIGLRKQKEQKEELPIRLNGLMQEYVKAGKDEEEQEHRLKCYQLFWDALEDSEFFEQKEQKPNIEICPHSVNSKSYSETGYPIEDCDYGLEIALNILEKTIGKVQGFQTDDGIREHQTAIKAVKDAMKEQKPAEKPKWDDSDMREDENELQTRFAFYTYKDDPTVLYLSNVFVEEASRNQGLGTRILSAAEKVAETIGTSSIMLQSKLGTPAIRLYCKNGFELITEQGGYGWFEKKVKEPKEQNPSDIAPNQFNGITYGMQGHSTEKPEWSKEDKEMIERLIRHIQEEYDELCNDRYGHQEIISDLKESCRERINWLENRLKSLRPQPQKDDWDSLQEDFRSHNVAFEAGREFERNRKPRWKPSEEQPIPDSTQLIAEWEKEKAVLKQKDFRGDAERMAYNAFLDGFVKGLGYEGTK